MAENENVLKPDEVAEEPVKADTPVEVNDGQPAPKQPSKGKKPSKGAKEWFRKKIVALKRKPQNIALLFLAVSTIYFMLSLFKISQAIYEVYTQEGVETSIGICIFVTTLLSLLVLVSFLNSFPKRKKPNIFFIVLVFLMIGAMIACDIVFYVQMSDILALPALQGATDTIAKVTTGQLYVIVHVALVGVSAVVFALLPAYRLLINKINTQVELESATENMHGAIDIQED
ncbi:MAG: hypothetical protein K2O28_01170 [Clostridia bacterium]|nr:hypothetical protein [Clostridia bacterium]